MKITKNERKQSRRILKHAHMQRKKDIGDNAKTVQREGSSQHKVRRITNLKQPTNSHLIQRKINRWVLAMPRIVIPTRTALELSSETQC